MRFSAEFSFRIAGAFVFAVAGIFIGAYLADQVGQTRAVWSVVFFLIGVLVGLIATPYFTTRPARWAQQAISQAPRSSLLAAAFGLLAGLVAAALLTLPLSQLPNPFGNIAPLVAVVVFVWLGITLFVLRRNDIMLVWGTLSRDRSEPGDGELSRHINGRPEHSVLLDTSVLIDGRIADIADTGFLAGPLIVPRFVLIELQHIADSADALRRNRGRRGLEVLARLQKDTDLLVRITDMDVEGVRQVDEKLVILGKQLRCPIMTNDYNLNRVAEIQSVPVLNINELANAVKVVLLPGETLTVKVIQEGKEQGQGIGYLEDGTMIVIEDGKPHIDSELTVLVTKVLQTSAGRMIFAKIDDTPE